MSPGVKSPWFILPHPILQSYCSVFSHNHLVIKCGSVPTHTFTEGIASHKTYHAVTLERCKPGTATNHWHHTFCISTRETGVNWLCFLFAHLQLWCTDPLLRSSAVSLQWKYHMWLLQLFLACPDELLSLLLSWPLCYSAPPLPRIVNHASEINYLVYC